MHQEIGKKSDERSSSIVLNMLSYNQINDDFIVFTKIQTKDF